MEEYRGGYLMGAQGKSSGVVLDGNRGVSEVEKAGRSNLRRSNS